MEEIRKDIVENIFSLATVGKELPYKMVAQFECNELPEWLDKRDRYGDEIYNDYEFQIFANTVKDILFEDEEKIIQIYTEEKNKSNPVTQTDGSKGQWEFAHKTKLKTMEWFLEQINSDYLT